MSILSKDFHIGVLAIQGKASWPDLGGQITTWVGAQTARAPSELQPLITQAGSDLKQGVSDLLSMAGTAEGPLLNQFATVGVPAFESMLAAATHGITTPFNPLITSGMDRLAAGAKTMIDASLMKWKADLAANAPPVAVGSGSAADAPVSAAGVVQAQPSPPTPSGGS